MTKRLLLFFNLFCCLTAFSQNPIRVSGKVTSAADGTSVMTSVVVKGTTRGISTDIDGNYVFSNVPSNAVLVFTALGFVKREVPVNGKTVLNTNCSGVMNNKNTIPLMS